MADEEKKEESGKDEKVEKETKAEKKEKGKAKKETAAKVEEPKKEKAKKEPKAKAEKGKKEKKKKEKAETKVKKEEGVEAEAKTEKEETVGDDVAAEAEKEDKEEKKEKKAKETKKEGKEKPLDKMTVIELREIAVEIPGVTGASAMKKEQLLEIIKEARGIKDEEPVKAGKKKALKIGVTTKALKKKIFQLKDEKEAAREARDRKKVAILRRRINRLKKQTRKVAQA